jgi:hypothetical protein
MGITTCMLFLTVIFMIISINTKPGVISELSGAFSMFSFLGTLFAYASDWEKNPRKW